eukprot:jgi/Botrbrau1/15104/Bobra.0240s0005.1
MLDKKHAHKQLASLPKPISYSLPCKRFTEVAGPFSHSNSNRIQKAKELVYVRLCTTT